MIFLSAFLAVTLTLSSVALVALCVNDSNAHRGTLV